MLVYCSYYSIVVVLIAYDEVMLNNYYYDVYNVEEIAHHNSFQLLIKKKSCTYILILDINWDINEYYQYQLYNNYILYS